jgi:hypothetical protein
VQLRSGRERRQGLAIGAVAVSSIWLLLAAVGVAAMASLDGIMAGLDEESTGTFVTDLDVGDCLAQPPASLRDDDDENSRVELTDCTERHRAQVYDIAWITGNPGPYPGQQEVLREATRDCQLLLPPAVKADVTAGRARVAVAYPGRAAWEYSSTATCLVVTPTDRTKGYDLRTM